MEQTFIPSVLFLDGARALDDTTIEAPECFGDLNLDQAVDEIVGRRDSLRPHFHRHAASIEEVAYRQDVFRDLEDPQVLAAINSFAATMVRMEQAVEQAAQRHYRYEPDAWLLEAARHYCQAVQAFGTDPALATATSRGLDAIRTHLHDYVGSETFRTLAADVDRVDEALGAVQYLVTLRGDRVEVSLFDAEPDFSAEILSTFERFEQGPVRSYTSRVGLNYFNHVEARIVELVARLEPEPFAALEQFGAQHAAFQDPTLLLFAREAQFYLAYADHMAKLQAAGLAFCHPQISDDKEIFACDAFDIALAAKLVADGTPIVLNDFELRDGERIIVISGPNQGGKTTFARMVGQLCHLACLGVPVPGSSARLPWCDRIFTHFEREEDLANLSGKLEDDLIRIRRILQDATPDSVVVMNESFTSTTLRDALILGRAVLTQLIELDLLCVYVTFVDELASLGPTTVSMMSTVRPEDPTARTFKVVRRPADGLAHALALAERHGLTYQRVRERIAR